MSRPCVFFDRDGIVNKPPPPEQYYVMSVEQFHLLPGFTDVLRLVRERGYEAVIITNQRGVALGRMTLETLHEIHDHLCDLLAQEGLALLDILVCVDGDDGSPRRKPNPGMLMEAAEKHGLDLARSWMVGDQERDVEAGRRAGVLRTVFVGGKEGTSAADHCVSDLAELLDFLGEELEDLSGAV